MTCLDSQEDIVGYSWVQGASWELERRKAGGLERATRAQGIRACQSGRGHGPSSGEISFLLCGLGQVTEHPHCFPYHPQSKDPLMVSLFSFVVLIRPLSPEHRVCRGTGSSDEDPGGTPCLSDLGGGDVAKNQQSGRGLSICLIGCWLLKSDRKEG